MAKKGKRNIKALIAKRAELQALSQRASVAIPGAPKVAINPPELPSPEVVSDKALPAYHPGREIWRTVLATIIIAVVLTAVVVTNRQSAYLDRFGDRVYDVLQLGS